MNRSPVHILFILLIAFPGCSRALIREPVRLSGERWDLTLVRLTLGPDQYITAGGCRVPREGGAYVWATVNIRNRLKTGQQFELRRIALSAGGKKVRPCIIDMDAVVTLMANPSPRLRPGESVTRKLVYMVRRGLPVESITYENAARNIPGTGAR